MIDEIGYKDLIIKLPEPNPVSVEVNNLLNEIKTQKIEDPFGWIVPVLTH
jgi:branched-chain amino acid aminotransferase